MHRHIRKLVGSAASPLWANRYIRALFAYHLYRRWIARSEATVALRRRPEALDEPYWMGKLRQYAHVMDKGIHRNDFSQGHGTAAYQLATEALSHLRSSAALSDPSVAWATRKIRQYEELQSGKGTRDTSVYVRTVCRYEALVDAIKTRRCIREFLDRPVEDQVIDQITDVVDWSPTSCSRQPARVYATNNPALVRTCVALHHGAACFSEIYAPLFMTFCADTRVYDMPGEMATPYIDVALGVQNCLLVAHTLGLSLTLLSWAFHSDAQEQALRKLFGIPGYLEIIVSTVGGYPRGGAEVPARKAKELSIVK